MTRDQFVELVRKNLQSSDAPAAIRGKYSERQIQLYAQMAYDDMIGIIGEEANKTKDYSLLDNFGKAYKRTVQTDTDREEKYIDLAIQVVPLGDNMGIRQVSPFKNQKLAFQYRDNNAQAVFSKLLVDVVCNVPTYYVELPRIYFDDKIEKDLKTIMVKLIPPFSQLKGDDDVFVPGGQNGRVFQTVLELIQNKERHPQMYNNSGSSKQI